MPDSRRAAQGDADGSSAATSTRSFGVGRRERHDASAFYSRFTPPVVSDDDEVALLPPVSGG